MINNSKLRQRKMLGLLWTIVALLATSAFLQVLAGIFAVGNLTYGFGGDIFNGVTKAENDRN